MLPTLPKTNMTPENDKPPGKVDSYWKQSFSGAYISFREETLLLSVPFTIQGTFGPQKP